MSRSIARGSARVRSSGGSVSDRVDGVARTFSAVEIADRCTSTCARLAALGVEAGTTVGVVASSRAEVLVLELATGRLGAQLVVIGPSCGADRATAMLQDAQPLVVACEHPEQMQIVRGLVDAVVTDLEISAPAGGSLPRVGHAASVPRSTPAPADDSGHLAVRRSGAGASVEVGHVVTVRAGLDSGTTRALAGESVDAGATVLLDDAPAPSDPMARADHVVAGASFVALAVSAVCERAPRPTPFPRLDALRILVCLGWALVGLLEVWSLVGRAAAATAALGALAVFAASRDGALRRSGLVVGTSAVVALVCRAAGVAPSMAALCETVVGTTSIVLGAAGLGRGIAARLWHRVTGLSADASPRTSAWARLTTAVSQALVQRGARRVVGLGRCRSLIVVGQLDPDVARTFEFIFRSIAVVRVDVPSGIARHERLVARSELELASP